MSRMSSYQEFSGNIRPGKLINLTMSFWCEVHECWLQGTPTIVKVKQIRQQAIYQLSFATMFCPVSEKKRNKVCNSDNWCKINYC